MIKTKLSLTVPSDRLIKAIINEMFPDETYLDKNSFEIEKIIIQDSYGNETEFQITTKTI